MSEHIFKPGDRAYSLRTLRWVDLAENSKDIKGFYPLKEKDSDETYMQDGRYDKMQGASCLIPVNPYDPTDPNNPPEFRYPFMLSGRPVKVGDVLYLPDIRKSGRVLSLAIDGVRKFCTVRNSQPLELSDENFRWPDELSGKKKVARWAYLIIGIPGPVTVGFTEEMTEEEARKGYGSSIQMIPGTEREVEE